MADLERIRRGRHSRRRSSSVAGQRAGQFKSKPKREQHLQLIGLELIALVTAENVGGVRRSLNRCSDAIPSALLAAARHAPCLDADSSLPNAIAAVRLVTRQTAAQQFRLIAVRQQ